MANVQPVSLDEFVKGGLISDVDVEIANALFTLEQPEGYTADKPPVFLKLTLKDLDSGEETDQWWSCGSAADFAPSEDPDEEKVGMFLLPQGSATHLREDSNFWALRKSLVGNCGMPENFLSTNGKGCKGLIGAQLHMLRAAATDKPGLSATNKRGGPREILIASKAIKTPWDKGKKPAAAAKGKTAAAPQTQTQTAAQAPAPAAASNGAVSDEHTNTLIGALAEIVGANNGKVDTTVAKGLLFKSLMQIPATTRNTLMQLVTNGEWLAGQGFKLEGNAISVA